MAWSSPESSRSTAPWRISAASSARSVWARATTRSAPASRNVRARSAATSTTGRKVTGAGDDLVAVVAVVRPNIPTLYRPTSSSRCPVTPSIGPPPGSTALLDSTGNAASAMRSTVTAGVKSNSWLPSAIASMPTRLRRSIMCAPLSNDDRSEGEIASPPWVTSTRPAAPARTSFTTAARRATPPRPSAPSRRSRSLTWTMVRVTGSARAGEAARPVAARTAAHRAGAAAPRSAAAARTPIRSSGCFIRCSSPGRPAAPGRRPGGSGVDGHGRGGFTILSILQSGIAPA